MTATIVESLDEFVVTLPDPKTGENWSLQLLNNFNDGINLIVSREREGMGLWIEDPEVLHSVAAWLESAALQIEETTHVRSTSNQE